MEIVSLVTLSRAVLQVITYQEVMTV